MIYLVLDEGWIPLAFLSKEYADREFSTLVKTYNSRGWKVISEIGSADEAIQRQVHMRNEWQTKIITLWRVVAQ